MNLANSAAYIPTAQVTSSMKDSRWLTLEVCREYQRNKCTRSQDECKFAHPPPHVEVQNGRVVCCYDSIKGKCQRSNPPCKYLHPPQHLRDQLLQNGRNNLILKSIQMQVFQQQILAQGNQFVTLPNTYDVNQMNQTLILAAGTPSLPLPNNYQAISPFLNQMSGSNPSGNPGGYLYSGISMLSPQPDTGLLSASPSAAAQNGVNGVNGHGMNGHHTTTAPAMMNGSPSGHSYAAHSQQAKNMQQMAYTAGMATAKRPSMGEPKNGPMALFQPTMSMAYQNQAAAAGLAAMHMPSHHQHAFLPGPANHYPVELTPFPYQ